MGNLKYIRTDLNEKGFLKDANGNPYRAQLFANFKPFKSKGTSIIYTAEQLIPDACKLYQSQPSYFKDNKLFFKATSHIFRGRNPQRLNTEESMGGCDDVAEVLCGQLLLNLSAKLGDKAILKGTPYEFAQLSMPEFWKVIEKGTFNQIQSDRLYGSLSPNMLRPGALQINGDALLGTVVPNNLVHDFKSNTLYNYQCSFNNFEEESLSNGQNIISHPILTRHLANEMFFDYLCNNTDRHSLNINFQLVPTKDGSILQPMPILDNGASFALFTLDPFLQNTPYQYPSNMNTEDLYTNLNEILLNQNGKFLHNGVGKPYNPFDTDYQMSVGEQAFKDQQIQQAYNNMTYPQQIIALVSQNRTLYGDFCNLYKGLDVQQGVESMVKNAEYNRNFIESLPEVAQAGFAYKQEELSQAMASLMGETYDENLFNANPNFYLDKLADYVKEDELNLKIATDEQIKAFDESQKDVLLENNTEMNQ